MACDKIIGEKKSRPVSKFHETLNDAPSAQYFGVNQKLRLIEMWCGKDRDRKKVW